MSNEESIRKVKFSAFLKEDQYDARDQIYWMYSIYSNTKENNCINGLSYFSIRSNRMEDFKKTCNVFSIDYEILE
jgi:hypothetical protein